MKCKDFEQEIYLYSELSEAEKLRMDKHIQECTACKELFQLVLSTQGLIAKSAKPELANHARMTSNIMQAIQAEPKKQSTLISLLQRSFVKYSFVAASIALVILFAAEQQTSADQRKTVIAGTVLLKSTSVANVLDQKNKQEVSLYACIKSENCNSTLVENLKQKHF